MTELQMAIASGQVSAAQIEAHRVAGELPIVMYEPRIAQSAQPVGIWIAKRYNDVPDGLTEVYPEEGPCQFLAPRGDGSIKGNEVWMITLPPLPNEQSTEIAQPEQPKETE